MKILMALMGLEIGGAETHVVELSKELKRRGHTVAVVSNGGVYEKELTDAGITCYNLPLHSRKISKMYKSYKGIGKLMKENNFDFIHAHARIPGFLCGLQQKRMKFRFMTSTHWVFKTGFLLNLMTDWGERTVAVSEDIKKYLIDNYNYPEDKISVTINGIDTEKFSPDAAPCGVDKEFKMSESKNRIVYVSRMDTDRSAVAFNLTEIAPKLCEKYNDAEIVIVGGGNDLERLEKAVVEANEKIGRLAIITTGARTDISNFIACGDMFVGVSRAALEAMSAAKPVIIAGNEGYIGTFTEEKLDISIKTNYCCRGCEMPDNDTLFKDICGILDKNEEERRIMGEYNRSVIVERYSVYKMADDYEEAYKKLLKNDPFRPNDVVISGYYGYKNIGDDSLLHAIVNNLRKEKNDIKITVLSANPKQTKKVFGVNSIYRFNPVAISKLLKKSRLLISGGGSLLQDVTSTKSMRYYNWVLKKAIKKKTKTMVYANGIGPINGEKNREICRKTLNNVDEITLREENSKAELAKIGVENKNIKVTADPAFSLDADKKNKIFADKKIPNDKKYFAVSIREWKGNENKLLPILAKTAEYVNKKYGLYPVIIPMQKKFDASVCQKLKDMMKCEAYIVEGSYGANQLIRFMQDCEFSIGMRLHALIYSLCAGTPVVGISYDPKVDSVLHSFDIEVKCDVCNPDYNNLITQIDGIMSDYSVIKGKIGNKAEEMRKRTEYDAKKAIDILYGM